jgi:hypothetical protein
VGLWAPDESYFFSILSIQTIKISESNMSHRKLKTYSKFNIAYCTQIFIFLIAIATLPSIAIRFQSTRISLQMSYFYLWHWKRDFECKSLIVWLLDTSRMTEGCPYNRAEDKSPSRYTVAVSVLLSLFLVPLAFSMMVSGNCVMNEYVWESMPQLCEHTHTRARAMHTTNYSGKEIDQKLNSYLW